MTFSVCFQLAFFTQPYNWFIFIVGASIMVQVPFSRFGSRVQFPSCSNHGFLFSFPQLTSPGVDWPIGISCFSVRPRKLALDLNGSRVGRCDLGFASSHISNKVKGWLDLYEQGSNHKEEEGKAEESADRIQILGPSHLWCLLLLQFIWAIYASFYPTWFVWSFCY